MIPSNVHLRENALQEVGRILRRERCRRPFFVVDQVAYSASGGCDVLEPLLQDLCVSRFTDFELNPKLADVQRGIAQYNDHAADFVIALGGGTAMDLGKLIGALARQPNPAREIVTGKAPLLPTENRLLAIPTTAGTGSEATHFAVVYVDHQKFSLADESLLPNEAIIDPTLTHSLPPPITAATGLDAFCQAIESIWAAGASEDSVRDATESLRHSLAHLVNGVRSPTPESRLAMCRASYLAGRAINVSKTTAPHALSYALTSDYGIPHGFAVAMTLGPMLLFNSQVSESDCADPRGVQHVRKRIDLIVELLGAHDVEHAREIIARILAEIGCPANLSAAGINDIAKIQRLVGSVNAQRMSNNPRTASPDSLVELLCGS
ncbi:phosphonoacetaldehyde reductase [Stieleria tagensis]|uniref:phosphonoacetaldehyde reductase n=1 Tax=Stieleria tagensis TaxID=2956795 RepID=UPI00209B522E|nr:phosphonoacetaldehyde reductase [Stieleria tagensis]